MTAHAAWTLALACLLGATALAQADARQEAPPTHQPGPAAGPPEAHWGQWRGPLGTVSRASSKQEAASSKTVAVERRPGLARWNSTFSSSTALVSVLFRPSSAGADSGSIANTAEYNFSASRHASFRSCSRARRRLSSTVSRRCPALALARPSATSGASGRSREARAKASCAGAGNPRNRGSVS